MSKSGAPVYDRVALIGLGLSASSMFWAIKRAGLAGAVTGYERSEVTRDTAVAYNHPPPPTNRRGYGSAVDRDIEKTNRKSDRAA